jgi:hypothetical protein
VSVGTVNKNLSLTVVAAPDLLGALVTITTSSSSTSIGPGGAGVLRLTGGEYTGGSSTGTEGAAEVTAVVVCKRSESVSG